MYYTGSAVERAIFIAFFHQALPQFSLFQACVGNVTNV